ncbi:MAG: transcriptional regulator, partial [Alphaproteobacteria bacterium]|nr:transcriptional regulator [Alphaproteobacteria bacterium]
MSAETLPLPDVEAMARLKAKAPEAADLLRQLANPTRLLILCHITREERAVGEMER